MNSTRNTVTNMIWHDYETKDKEKLKNKQIQPKMSWGMRCTLSVTVLVAASSWLQHVLFRNFSIRLVELRVSFPMSDKSTTKSDRFHLTARMVIKCFQLCSWWQQTKPEIMITSLDMGYVNFVIGWSSALSSSIVLFEEYSTILVGISVDLMRTFRNARCGHFET
jgi:hypothetical protein